MVMDRPVQPFKILQNCNEKDLEWHLNELKKKYQIAFTVVVINDRMANVYGELIDF